MAPEQKDENRLEQLLRLAADEPAHRPEFFRVLLDADVFVLGTAGGIAEGQTNLEQGSKVQIVSWGKEDGSPVLPFFSSLRTLQRAIEGEETYLQLPARSLFEMTAGATLFLNPKAPYGKEFVPEEVQHLLQGGFRRSAQERVVEKETRVLLGQPANYPAKMIDSLTQLLAKHPNVQRAYLALMHDASVDEKPHLVVGIEATGDVARVMAEAGDVAADTAPEGEPVDLTQVGTRDEGGLNRYFVEETQPFYERGWGAKLKGMFGGGRA